LPVLRENVTHRVNGLLFRAGDAEDLARQAEAFFAEPDLARLGDAGRREMLRTCSWERIAALTREVYAELDPHYRGIGSLMAS
jgi:glycosyltransferase involved in cell wall biosynthesis